MTSYHLDPERDDEDPRKGARWWHWPAVWLFVAGLWVLDAYNSGGVWHWGDVAMGFITGMMFMAWAVDFTDNKTAHTILKEWAEELARRSDRR